MIVPASAQQPNAPVASVEDKKIDSLLYENIPGKIVSKTTIVKNGYKGFDITNKTRRGDIQRYNIFVTPFEIVLFKMGGKENYTEGKEAAQFFSSIQLKEINNTATSFTPKQGGFSIHFHSFQIIALLCQHKPGITHIML